jgi:hypothetical protein
MTSTGKLSMTLTPLHNLTHVQKEVCQQLLEEANLIVQQPTKNTLIYHQVAEVHAVSKPEGIRLFN